MNSTNIWDSTKYICFTKFWWSRIIKMRQTFWFWVYSQSFCQTQNPKSMQMILCVVLLMKNTLGLFKLDLEVPKVPPKRNSRTMKVDHMVNLPLFLLSPFCWQSCCCTHSLNESVLFRMWTASSSSPVFSWASRYQTFWCGVPSVAQETARLPHHDSKLNFYVEKGSFSAAWRKTQRPYRVSCLTIAQCLARQSNEIKLRRVFLS